MAAPDRVIPTSVSTPPVTGPTFMNAVQDELTGLWNFAVIKLTAVSGTNDITGTPAPALTGALVDGMNFILVPANTNTSTVMRLDVGTGLKSLVDRDGNAPPAGSVKAASSYLVTWDNGLNKFKIVTYLPPLAFVDRPSFRNILVNGGCEIWQRGSSIAIPSSTTAYHMDRWYLTTGALQAFSINRQAGLSNRSQFSGTIQRNNGQAGTSTVILAYPLTTDECIRLRGSKCSLSFLAQAGANWSPTSGTITYNVYFGTGGEGKRGAGFTGETNPITGTVNLPAGGAVQTVSVTSAANVATNVTQGEVKISWVPTGTAGVADAMLLDDVQLEVAVAPTEFEYLPFGYMLRELQRHYTKTFAYATTPAQNAGLSNSVSGSQDVTWIKNMLAALAGAIPTTDNTAGSGACGPSIFWQYPVKMRTTPTITTFNPSAANANIRIPLANSTPSALDSTASISPVGNNGDGGVTIGGTGVGSSAGPSAPNNVGAYVGYIHATADASL